MSPQLFRRNSPWPPVCFSTGNPPVGPVKASARVEAWVLVGGAAAPRRRVTSDPRPSLPPLQNKEFVCRGYDYERLEDFQQRMLGEFPQAIAMQHPNQPDDTILQSDAQCILSNLANKTTIYHFLNIFLFFYVEFLIYKNNSVIFFYTRVGGQKLSSGKE